MTEMCKRRRIQGLFKLLRHQLEQTDIVDQFSDATVLIFNENVGCLARAEKVGFRFSLKWHAIKKYLAILNRDDTDSGSPALRKLVLTRIALQHAQLNCHERSLFR